MINTFRVNPKLKGVVLGQLIYGTFVTSIPSNPDSVYIKVDKKKLHTNVTLCVPPRHSALLNVKTGSLRTISGDTKVTVLLVDAQLVPLTTEESQEFCKY